MIVDRDQELLIELEGGGELDHRLPHTVQELSEDWGELPIVGRQVAVPEGQTRGWEEEDNRGRVGEEKQEREGETR